MPEPAPPLVELDDLAAFDDHVTRTGSLVHTVIHGVDLSARTDVLLRVVLTGAVLLGCAVEAPVLARLAHERVLTFPSVPGLPFRMFRSSLYSPDELFAGHRAGDAAAFAATPDQVIFRWHQRAIERNDLVDLLAQRIHDHSVDDALREVIDSVSPAVVVAIMGGHGMARGSTEYREVALLARALTRSGRFCASGGGPGAMEATNLGAWFTGRADHDLDDALGVLAGAPMCPPEVEWLDAAFEVRRTWPLPPGALGSLGVPTWHYGHEPPNVFATHIAKYFANSIREDGLLAMALGGVVFAPGSAGTIQEVFQDAAQNHYRSFGVVSPMVFMGRDHWTSVVPVYPLLQQLAAGYEYGEQLAIGDTVEEILSYLGITAPPT